MSEKIVETGYFNVKELSKYSGISQRTLRYLMKSSINPIPPFRIGGRLLRIKKTEFDNWMGNYKVKDSIDVDAIVNEILN
ncbi:MAG: helix-turn-helix domain-containing protein [Desulfobacterales bacterium]|nr:helix-turn-helix domain-containing protein [Desulfobacterales bacterium]